MKHINTLFGQNLEQVNPLQVELSAQYILQKTQDLYDQPLLFMFLADDFSGHSVFSPSHCMLTTFNFRCQGLAGPKWILEHLSFKPAIQYFTYEQSTKLNAMKAWNHHTVNKFLNTTAQTSLH